jgi:hypothetical protein
MPSQKEAIVTAGAKKTSAEIKDGGNKNSSRMQGTSRIHTLVSSDVSKWM